MDRSGGRAPRPTVGAARASLDAARSALCARGTVFSSEFGIAQGGGHCGEPAGLPLATYFYEGRAACTRPLPERRRQSPSASGMASAGGNRRTYRRGGAPRLRFLRNFVGPPAERMVEYDPRMTTMRMRNTLAAVALL